MHIPDGFVDGPVVAATCLASATGVGIAMARAGRSLPPSRVPLMGLSAAFIFAAQMINFPVASGTSGHLMGTVLAAVLLGPAAAIIVMASVLTLQALMFADGGISALGANVLNMGIIGALVGYAIYWPISRMLGGLRGRIAGAAFAAWCSTVIASIACAAEIALSGKVAWHNAFPAMAGVHMLIGIGEGLITAMALLAVAQTRPELLGVPALTLATESRRGSNLRFAAAGLMVAMVVGVLISPFASPWPDGLEWVAEQLHFIGSAAGGPSWAPLPDYGTDRISSAELGTALAGGVGTFVMFVGAWVLAWVLVPRVRDEAAAS